MSFDQDPGEQAQISGSDFALMCDEMKRLKALNAELVLSLDVLIDIWDDSQKNAPEHRCYVSGAFGEEIEKAREVLAKNKGETA